MAWNLVGRWGTSSATGMPKFIQFESCIKEWRIFLLNMAKIDLWPTFDHQDDLLGARRQWVKCRESHGLSSCQIPAGSTQAFSNCGARPEWPKWRLNLVTWPPGCPFRPLWQARTCSVKVTKFQLLSLSQWITVNIYSFRHSSIHILRTGIAQ